MTIRLGAPFSTLPASPTPLVMSETTGSSGETGEPEPGGAVGATEAVLGAVAIAVAATRAVLGATAVAAGGAMVAGGGGGDWQAATAMRNGKRTTMGTNFDRRWLSVIDNVFTAT